MEPAWLVRDEAQAYSRIRRISQENDTHTYRYLARDNIEETNIIVRQKRRAELNVQTFKVEVNNDIRMVDA